MSNSVDTLDHDLEQELNKGLKYSDGILNIVDEMARREIIKNKNVNELNLLFTLQDFCQNNEETNIVNKRREYNNPSKQEPEFINECSRKELPKPKKKKRNKFESFSKIQANPIKRVNSVNKNNFSNQFNKDSKNKINNLKSSKNNNMQKKYININRNRLSVLVNPDNFIKHMNTNPKKGQLYKFLNKDKDNNKNNNNKNQIENLVTNRPENKNFKKKVTFSNKNSNDKDKDTNRVSIEKKNPPENEANNNNKSFSIQSSPKNENNNNNILSIQNSPKNESINNEIKYSIKSKNSYKNESNSKIPELTRNSSVNNQNAISFENSIPQIKDNQNRISPQNNVQSNNEIIDDETILSNKNPSKNEKYNKSKFRVSNKNINGKKINKDNIIKSNRNSSIKERNINNTNDNLRKNSNNEININDIINNDSYSDELDNFDIESVEPEIPNYNINITKNYSKIKGKRGLDRIYYVEMKNLERKKRKLDKERQLIIEQKMSEMQKKPILNSNTIDIITRNNNKYIPIQERAAKIHNRKRTQIMLNDMQKKLDKENEEKKDLEEIRLHKSKKKYDPDEWDEFVQSQNNWIKEVNYKRKAAQILQSRKYNYKPKMNPKSRNIINKLTKKKNVSMDDVFDRLYNDVEDREERQKVLDKNYIPPFKPRQGNSKYIKFINKRKNRNIPELFITSYDKNNYFLNSQIAINGGYIYPMNSSSHIIKRNNRCKYCYLKNEKNKNNTKSFTIDNSTIFGNKSTNENTFGLYSKAATIEPYLATESFISSNPRNYYNNYRINQSFDNKYNLYDNYEKNKKSIRLNKSNQNRMNSNINTENLKYYNNRNNYSNYPLNYNETINITKNKYNNFFNIENIEDL